MIDPAWLTPIGIFAMGLISAVIGKFLERDYKRRHPSQEANDGD